MARMSDAEARTVLEAAFAMRQRPHPTLGELQGVGAIARFEGGYGGAWTGAGADSHNWGAIQCSHQAPCSPGCFEHGDSHADGSGYRGCFRIYASHVAGAAALLHELYRRAGVPEALVAGDAAAVADRMRASGYFEAPSSAYASAIERHAAEIASSLGEPVAIRRGGVALPVVPPPTPASPPPLPPAVATASAEVEPWFLVGLGLAWGLYQFRRRP
ncbi:MAG: hypothetical protein R3B72_51305 [Polyangiaceae bacterium]